MQLYNYVQSIDTDIKPKWVFKQASHRKAHMCMQDLGALASDDDDDLARISIT